MPLFVYGSLLFPELLQALLGRVPEYQAARLEGYRRYQIYDGKEARPYPAVYPCLGASVEGLLLLHLTEQERIQLDEYEDEDYIRHNCEVLVGEAHMRAQVYVWREEALGQLRDEWEPEIFRQHYLRLYVEYIKENL
jgi:gamma-glutamylcyclotransferase (GGCT)/AIG2-like uncharacterized protein YtfP